MDPITMPFPSGNSWLFEVVPPRANGLRVSSFKSDWGVLLFDLDANNQPIATLEIGDETQSNTQSVVWTGDSMTEGHVTPASGNSLTFTLSPTLQYSFHQINVSQVTLRDGTTTLIVHVASATLITANGPIPVFFTAISPNSHGLDPRKDLPYTDASDGTTPLFSITPRANNMLDIVGMNGWSPVATPVSWTPPSQHWPPSLSFQLQNGSQTKSYSGVVTAQYDHNGHFISYLFGGSIHTAAPGGPASDDDWTTTSNSDPVIIGAKKAGYA